MVMLQVMLRSSTRPLVASTFGLAPLTLWQTPLFSLAHQDVPHRCSSSCAIAPGSQCSPQLLLAQCSSPFSPSLPQGDALGNLKRVHKMGSKTPDSVSPCVPQIHVSEKMVASLVFLWNPLESPPHVLTLVHLLSNAAFTSPKPSTLKDSFTGPLQSEFLLNDYWGLSILADIQIKVTHVKVWRSLKNTRKSFIFKELNPITFHNHTKLGAGDLLFMLFINVQWVSCTMSYAEIKNENNETATLKKLLSI